MLKTLKAPAADPSLFSTREKVILLNGSKLHGSKFWPWEQDPLPREFDGDEFVDDTNFHFSPEQLQLFSGWKRASGLRNAVAASYSDGPVDLVQDVSTDCSVVASLCALTARTEMLGHDACLSAIMHPSNGYPANGRFIFKFNFNGCYRKVEIDHRLPASKTERSLHVFDRKDPATFWPALVEKAYLKVRGGYDFPGSNSGTDLWVLIGWIPEQVFLRSNELVPTAFWKRVLNAFNYGDVLITIGTGKLSYQEERIQGLVSEHAYAIIGMKEEGSRRLFHIKNPWSHGGIWTGSSEQEVSQLDGGTMHANEAARPGTFWMDLDYVFQNFLTIYLNWNPGLFGHRHDVHFTWDLAVRSPPESLSNNPQYILRSRKGGSVWLLLSKHFQNFSRDDRDRESIDPRLQTGFLSLYAYEQQYRTFLASGALMRAPYVNAPSVLLRFEMPADTTYIIVPSEEDMPTTRHTFTLSAFTANPLAKFKVAEQRYPHCSSQAGSWTITTSGGNTSSPTFFTNPQFRLHVPQTTDLSILLETSDPELAVQLKLVWAGGKRIPHSLTKRDVYSDSGEYQPGSTIAVIPHVLAGTYTIVCSTFGQGQLGDFNVRVWSMTPCTLTAIPNAEPGVFTTTLAPAIFPYSVDRILAPVNVQRLTRFHALAQPLLSHGIPRPSPLKLSLEFGQGANKFVLASTERFVDGVARLEERDLRSDMCKEGSPGLWLVVERLGAGAEVEEKVRVEVFGSERGVTVGEWGMASEEPIELFQAKLKISDE